ncbi:toll/interleukin-1 receptor domain-containing protein [Agrobacterium tumefaciens]|uniref:toll/interleukin-1 receptor domain-containing protein n=1 Tax=Agrobacterium tumefaciens TaxID=358 RepID=UPI000DE2F79C|nr:toll/interleukin-1 receptor domain-containing protein [Agrobacterium tumefaciens]NSX87658.1 toll/interleukin-1 receptor domain-containing protein [Agrobacterium tumefaciens]
MIKVFISHQAADSQLAKQIADRLSYRHGISYYLDVVDNFTSKPGEDISAHIQSELKKCTQLLAVVSAATRTSWWVPWEIGIATEKEYPLATYVAGTTAPPEYLQKWPYLRSEADVDRYADASKGAERISANRTATFSEGTQRTRATKEFYRIIRSSLGQ